MGDIAKRGVPLFRKRFLHDEFPCAKRACYNGILVAAGGDNASGDKKLYFH